MRILILANFDIGLYKFRRELLEALAKENEAFFCVPNGEYVPRLTALGGQYIPFDFHRRGINPLSDLRQMLFYRKLIRKTAPDIVLTYTIKPNVYGGLACQMTGTPYLANVTGLGTAIENRGVLSRISMTLYKFGLRKASCVFFQNEKNREFFLRRKAVSGKTRMIPGSGVNLETFLPEAYPADGEAFRFLFVGRVMRDKGIGELLKAMKILHGENPRVTLDIAGMYDEDYSAAMQTAEQSGAVRYHGQVNDVRPFYRECHCVVLPSYHEGMANVLLEGAATARPVIASRIPGCAETFDEGVTGLGCEAKSAESLLDAMRRFLKLSWEQREQMGQRGRAKMEREFDRRIVIQSYLEEISCAVKESGIP